MEENIQYTTSFIVFPENCNHHRELIFGGWFMSQIDLAAAICVKRYLLNNIDVSEAVTHKFEVDFKKPCYVGDMIELECELSVTGPKSITVEVVARRHNVGREGLVAKAKLVFITIADVKSLEDHPTFLPYKEHGWYLDGTN